MRRHYVDMKYNYLHETFKFQKVIKPNAETAYAFCAAPARSLSEQVGFSTKKEPYYRSLYRQISALNFQDVRKMTTMWVWVGRVGWVTWSVCLLGE